MLRPRLLRQPPCSASLRSGAQFLSQRTILGDHDCELTIVYLTFREILVILRWMFLETEVYFRWPGLGNAGSMVLGSNRKFVTVGFQEYLKNSKNLNEGIRLWRSVEAFHQQDLNGNHNSWQTNKHDSRRVLLFSGACGGLSVLH